MRERERRGAVDYVPIGALASQAGMDDCPHFLHHHAFLQGQDVDREPFFFILSHPPTPSFSCCFRQRDPFINGSKGRERSRRACIERARPYPHDPILLRSRPEQGMQPVFLPVSSSSGAVETPPTSFPQRIIVITRQISRQRAVQLRLDAGSGARSFLPFSAFPLPQTGRREPEEDVAQDEGIDNRHDDAGHVPAWVGRWMDGWV